MDKMDRHSASEAGVLFHTYEMVEWLRIRTSFSDDMIKALLGAWIGVLRYEALLRAEDDKQFLFAMQNGEVVLRLSGELTPEGWDDQDVLDQLYHETGVSYPETSLLLSLIAEKFSELNGKAFEPIGWIQIGSGKDKGKFLVRYWEDFLGLRSHEPEGIEEEPLVATASSNQQSAITSFSQHMGRSWSLNPLSLFRRSS
jgi:hypothetical protein